ncbi:hypothetical protein [Alcaligenes sp. WGS1538]|uniref:hypothetical protein n=1 Tax=Alcaligenes sp. WGS1538 TaxID=3366811 RepID=UPI00372CEC05
MHTFRRVVKSHPNIAARYEPVELPAVSEIDYLIANLADKDGRPLIDYWISPLASTLAPDGSSIMDRRQPQGMNWGVTSGSGVVSVTDGRIVLPGTFNLAAGAPAVVNPSAFTVVARVHPVASSIVVGTERGSISGTGSVSIGVPGILTAAGGAGNVADNAGDVTNTDLVATVTFSTVRGVSIRRNGVQTYANAGRTAANLGNRLYIGGTGTATNYYNGNIGYLLYSLRDLSDPALRPGLAAIERALVELG